MARPDEPQPDPEVAAAVAGLAREVDGLRRTVESLTGMPGRVDELARLVTQLADTVAAVSARPGPTPAPSWLLLPDDEDVVARVLGELCAWLHAFYLRYSDAAASLPECWLWHPEVVEELLWLRHAWCAAYQGKSASVALAGDWHDRQRPGVVRRIKQYAGSCSPERHQARPEWDQTPTGAAPVPGRCGRAVHRRVVGHRARRARSRTGAGHNREWSSVPMTTTTDVERHRDAVQQEASPAAAVRAHPGGRMVRAAIWLPGLAVAVGAAVATAHGLYEVAVAARVPAGIAWLYPLITDGLALVAYAATARLHGSAARYAWSVVILAAGLSGLAQAAYLASDHAPAALPARQLPPEAAAVAFEASPALRFGVGAWPAIAAAIVAHLLYLLATDNDPAKNEPGGDRDQSSAPERSPVPERSAVAVQPAPFNAAAVQPEQDPARPAVAPAAVQRPAAVTPAAPRPALAPAPVEQRNGRPPVSPARDRARAAAARHAHRHGALPTVSELEAAAEVSRGTAATVLKHLRQQPTPLHLITTSSQQDPQQDDPTLEEHTQP
ncbi:DUF2637 domain-containing protein [Pseudonocardia nigra]|uniref:DUF2637 domain-containing protein n=1 Tax=Pseudonocardia nigra TaxID=1921578 RepID=UPI001FEC8BF0|nr:DUF2637 domain-containing protein [Pseudonocardia nigra]